MDDIVAVVAHELASLSSVGDFFLGHRHEEEALLVCVCVCVCVCVFVLLLVLEASPFPGKARHVHM
jgi:hypothetical protein